MKYRTQGSTWVYRPDGTIVARADSYIDSERFADELNKASAPKMMKRFSEDCKPEAAGWYWVAYRGYEPAPEFFVGFESESRNETIWSPLWWLEMENRPTIPEGEA